MSDVERVLVSKDDTVIVYDVYVDGVLAGRDVVNLKPSERRRRMEP